MLDVGGSNLGHLPMCSACLQTGGVRFCLQICSKKNQVGFAHKLLALQCVYMYL